MQQCILLIWRIKFLTDDALQYPLNWNWC